MKALVGNASKDSRYLKRIKEAVQHEKDHPVHNGIKMQAHHIISAKAMEESGKSALFKKFGYDINLLPNLVFLPCTLQGSCHIRVQPHRGNHNVAINEDVYNDDEHPETYHDFVAKLLRNVRPPEESACLNNGKLKSKEVDDMLNELSKKILGMIERRPLKAPLTKIAGSFHSQTLIGCGGVDSVRLHKPDVDCAVHRNHLQNKKSELQKPENITYKMDKPFKLTPGR